MKTNFLLALTVLIIILTSCTESKPISNYWKIASVGSSDYRMDYTPHDSLDQHVSVKLINKRDTVNVMATCEVSIVRMFSVIDNKYYPYVVLVFTPSDEANAKLMEKAKTNKSTFQYYGDELKNMILIKENGHYIMSIPFEEKALLTNFALSGKQTMAIKTRNARLETTFCFDGEEFLAKYERFIKMYNQAIEQERAETAKFLKKTFKL